MTDRFEWPTLLLMAATYIVWGAGTLLWDVSGLLSVVVVGVAIAQHSSLQHEALHGHPFRNAALNEALVFPALSVFVPYRRFRDTHLRHHHDPTLTDPYDDPESNFLDPSEWAQLSGLSRVLWRTNNTLAGRMVLGPLLGTLRFVRTDLMALRNRAIWTAWAVHAAGLVMVLVWLIWAAMPVWAYLLSVWLGFALLKIRTYLEHRAHAVARARTVVIEDRGPLSLLFLNNNFHAVHHMHPQVSWYRLPGLYAARKAHYLARNEGYVYRNYGEVFGQFFLRAKDPVAHPVWPVTKQTDAH